METQEKFLLGALIGSAIGAAAALMFAPVSGYSLRKRIIRSLHLENEPPVQKAPLHPRSYSRRRPTGIPRAIPKRPIAKRKVHPQE